MITELQVSNFRSLGEDVRVRFEPFTALVGPNGSGKSNVVDAIRFVTDAVQMGLSGAITHRNGMAAVRRWSAGHPYNVAVRLSVRLADGEGTYSFELTGDRAQEYRVKTEEADVLLAGERHRFRIERGEWREGPDGLRPSVDESSLALAVVGGDARFKPLVTALQRIVIYSIFPDTLRTPQKYSPARPMSRHGENWVSVLKDQPAETWKPELIAALERLTGDIEDVKVTTAASYLVVQFRHRSETRSQKWFDSAQESDGTLRFAGIITALLQQPQLPVIGIEEPELTVHPGALPLLYDHLHQASLTSQVVVTTHSPELLDLFRVEQVRVVQRKDGASTVACMEQGQREAVRARLLTIGDLMRTEGLQQELFPSVGIGR